jgi:DNA-binding NarL/FixJ family response regulator
LTTEVDIDNAGCHPDDMPQAADFPKEFDELRRVKADALSHWVKAQELHQLRKVMMKELIAKGFSQADIARELSVSRQAVQKMLTL